MVRRKNDVDSSEDVTEDVVSPVVRGDLPDGFMTPSDFAYHVTTLGIYQDRKGRNIVLPQMIYSGSKSIKNPFPLDVVEDTNGNSVKAVNVDAGVEWFNARAEHKANIAANGPATRTATPKSNLDRLINRAAATQATLTKIQLQIDNGGEPYTDENGTVVDMVIRGRGRKPKNVTVVDDEDSE